MKSAFDRMGAQSKAIEELNESSKLTAASVSVGGDLYSRIDALVTVLEGMASGKSSGGGNKTSIKEAMAMAIMAPTLKPIGTGLGYIVEALNKLGPDGEKKAKAMEGIAGALSKLGEVGKSIFAFAGYMALSIPLLIITAMASPLIAIALFATIGAVMLVAKILDKKKLKALAQLKKVGLALLVFAGSMALISLFIGPALKGAIGVAIILGIIGITLKLLDVLGILDGKRLKEFGTGMMMLGLGILAMAISFALVQLIMPQAMMGAVWALGIILVMGLMFWFLDKMGIDKSMKEGIMAIAMAGIAIVGLGLAFAIFKYLIPDMATIWAAIKMLAIIGGTFMVIGLMQKPIMTGAKALLWASLAIIVVALSFIILNALIPPGEMTLESFKPLLVIAGVGAAFALIGLGASLIQSGAVAMILAGVSIILIALAVRMIAKPLEKGGWTLIGQIGALIAMLGIEFGLFGLAAPFILAGAAAMLVAGVAMIAIAGGTAAMGAVLNKSKKLLAPAPSGDGSNLSVLLNTIGDSFSMWPWRAAGIILGAGAMLTAGLALISIGVGVGKFQKVAEKADLPKLAENIAFMIGSLAVPFNLIGGGGTLSVKDPMTGKMTDIKFTGGGGGFFGLGGSNPVAMGISSVHGMGAALTGIAKGVSNMASLKFPTGFDKEGNATGYETLSGDIWKTVIENTVTMIGSLAVPFAMIGRGLTITDPETGEQIKLPGGGKKGLLASIFGGGESNPVADGISSVQGMGEALTGIAMGVQAMAMLKMPTGFDPETGKPNGFEKFNLKHAETVTENTKTLITALSGTFAAVGNDPNAKRSWWGGKSTIQKGIDLVTGMGMPLKNLATGVQDMANLKFAKGYDAEGKATGYYSIDNLDKIVPKIESNAQMLIKALTNVFTTIGGSEGAKGRGWKFWKPTKFEKGIKLVEKIADPFRKLAGAAKDAANIVKDVKNAEEVREKVKAMIQAITEAGGEKSQSEIETAIRMINALGYNYNIFSTAIPKIVAAVNSFQAKQGKAFMSVFGGDSTPETLMPKLMMLKGLSTAYGKMSGAIPKMTAAINTLSVEQMSSFVRLIGGTTIFPGQTEAKTKMYIVIGKTFSRMGDAIPKISSSINSLDPFKATVMKNMFIGPVSKIRPIAGYTAQAFLWRSIGRNMTANAKSFPEVANAINSMDLTKLKESRQMFEALAVLSSQDSPDDILAAMGESLEKALENLAEMIEKFKTTVSEGNAENATILESAAGAVGGAIGAFGRGITGGGGGDSAQVVSAVNSLRKALVSTGVKVSNMPDELG
jgi:hypothetical protein|tara:strand:- start:3710 stop:7579 length:3870 start_codon:yes stop_codon:yes gene_type:complete